ncbi:MAG TPA: hypothetical protein VFN91_04595 [Myxococcaceae bacterium]|nr:hypothetical protein [Myxococcaceae bacterium]
MVDFTRYSLVTTGGVDAGFEQLQLTFLAVDRLGHTSTTSFNECRRRQRCVWQSTSANNAPDLAATNAFPGNARCARALNGTTTVCTSTGCTSP